MIVCIAEKPSVAKDIAEVIGAKTRHNGYYEGNGYQVTWTFGHFCTLKEPQDYTERWKTWRIEDLPMIPQPFGIKVMDNAGVKKQFQIIESLLQSCNTVINCGDAGQEGELIQRWVLLKAKNKKPVKRLWISSLTTAAIRKGFENLKESQQYDNLYAAGNARAIGDWLLGINATRLFTKKFAAQKTLLSIGRVQTPTLAMLVARQKEIDSFVPEEFWELKTLYREILFTATIERLKSADKADKGLEYLKDKIFKITHTERKEAKESNPRLFDLTGLQVEANKRYGYSAEESLKLVQTLYERKLVTYPRVDTTYLSEDIYPQITGVLHNMQGYAALTAPLLQAPIPKPKAVFNDEKVTDHHAIIPTDVKAQGLSAAEQHIYHLICLRFIAVFYPECKVANTQVLAQVEKIEFKATGKEILEWGWREVYAQENKKKEEEDDKEVLMPNFTVGEEGPHEPFIHRGKTTAPKAYTEATLLRAMETAGKQVEDEDLRELLKENGIGRPSTRANIIETLFRRKYIEKKRKNLYATPMGIQLIDTISYDLLKSPELTGAWEQKLRMIEKGQYEAATFKQELIEMVSDIVTMVKQSRHRVLDSSAIPAAQPKAQAEAKSPEITEMQCPKCKSYPLKKGHTAYGCGNFKQCGFKIDFIYFDKKLSPKQTVDLLLQGKTGMIKNLVHQGEKISARLAFDSDFNITLS